MSNDDDDDDVVKTIGVPFLELDLSASNKKLILAVLFSLLLLSLSSSQPSVSLFFSTNPSDV